MALHGRITAALIACLLRGHGGRTPYCIARPRFLIRGQPCACCMGLAAAASFSASHPRAHQSTPGSQHSGELVDSHSERRHSQILQREPESADPESRVQSPAETSAAGQGCLPACCLAAPPPHALGSLCSSSAPLAVPPSQPRRECRRPCVMTAPRRGSLGQSLCGSACARGVHGATAKSRMR